MKTPTTAKYLVLCGAIAVGLSAATLTASAQDESTGPGARVDTNVGDPATQSAANAQSMNAESTTKGRREQTALNEHQRNIERYDADNDGKLNEAEIRAMENAQMSRYDLNKDGKLSDAEREAARRNMELAWDTDGNGRLDADERAAMLRAQRNVEAQVRANQDTKH